MEMNTYVNLVKSRTVGEQDVTLTHPMKLKVHTTGDNPAMLFEDGPSGNKTWTVTVRIIVSELL